MSGRKAGSSAACADSSRDAGYTLIELLIVVVIIGIMLTVAVGSFAGMVQGMNNSLAQSSLQATRVSLAGATVQAGSVPVNASGQPVALPANIVQVPADNAEFKIGYVPGCFQILDNAGVAQNKWLHNGVCTASDKAASMSGVKPLLEIEFVLCAQYGSGPVYIADSWHSVREYQSGGTWPDGTAMNLRGCTPQPITDSGGTIPPQT